MASDGKTLARDADASADPAGSYRRTIPLDDILPSEDQPRRWFDPVAADALAESIRRHGVLQPVLVTPSACSPGRFVLVAGERRWRAARVAGLADVPAMVVAAGARRRLELALVENVQRTDLAPLERARAYQHLIDEFGMTQAQVAKAVGVSRPTVANTLRLQNLEIDMQQALMEGRITESHGRTLVGITDLATRRRLFLGMLSGQVNVREAERAARASPARERTTDVELEHVAERLQWRLGTRVRFVGTRKSGRIQIEYRDSEDLDVLLGMLLPE